MAGTILARPSCREQALDDVARREAPPAQAGRAFALGPGLTNECNLTCACAQLRCRLMSLIMFSTRPCAQ
jgi:hypothetical protein